MKDSFSSLVTIAMVLSFTACGDGDPTPTLGTPITVRATTSGDVLAVWAHCLVDISGLTGITVELARTSPSVDVAIELHGPATASTTAMTSVTGTQSVPVTFTAATGDRMLTVLEGNLTQRNISEAVAVLAGASPPRCPIARPPSPELPKVGPLDPCLTQLPCGLNEECTPCPECPPTVCMP